MSNFLNKIIKSSGNKYASIVKDGLPGSDITGYVDTGSMMFNALLSGSIFNGIPNNKVLGLAGESATGKTYFTLGVVNNFLNQHKNGVVLYWDSEQAVTTDMFVKRGIDTSRVSVLPVATVEDFRKQANSIVDSYLEENEKERVPMMFVLDSLGMLSTSKEMADVSEGKETRDMTRAQLIKSSFRVLMIKLGNAKIPMIVTNHTYSIINSYVPTKQMGGGDGLRYAASTVVYLSKKKDKDASGETIGSIIHCNLYKGRFTKENQVIDVRLNYDNGVEKYYGLVDLALEAGIFTKNSTRIVFPDGSSAFEKHIYSNPEKYFTPEVLKKLDEAAAKKFKYGMGESVEESIEEIDTDGD